MPVRTRALELRDLEQALHIWEQHFGPDHPEVAITLGNLGNALLGLGKPGEARPLYERALRIEEQHFGPDHPKVAATLFNLGIALRELGEPGLAAAAFTRAWRIFRSQFGPDHKQTQRGGQALRAMGCVPLDDGSVYCPDFDQND